MRRMQSWRESFVKNCFELGVVGLLLSLFVETATAGIQDATYGVVDDSSANTSTIFHDTFNRPDGTGDIWGVPVCGEPYEYLNPANADFAISSGTGYLDDDTQVGDPAAVSSFSPVSDDFTLEFSMKYEGGRGSGLRLYSSDTVVCGISQDYDGYVNFYDGTSIIPVEPRENNVWKNYRIELLGASASIYINDVLKLVTPLSIESFDNIRFWAQGMTSGYGTSDTWYDDVTVLVVTPGGLFSDNFNRPDGTGDIWGVPVCGGPYQYLHPANADFAISNGAGYLDDNTQEGDPTAVSNFAPVSDDFTLEFSMKYEGGRGSGLRLHSSNTIVCGLSQDYDGYVNFYNGTSMIPVEPRENNVWKDYRIVVSGTSASIYINDVLKLVTPLSIESFDNIRFWAQGVTSGYGTSDTWYDNVLISQLVNVESPVIESIFSTPLLRVSPNPSMTSQIIEYDLPYQDFIVLEVYDISGRRVRRILSEELLAGEHDHILTNLGAGVYFCRLSSSNSGAYVTKFVVLE